MIKASKSVPIVTHMWGEDFKVVATNEEV